MLSRCKLRSIGAVIGHEMTHGFDDEVPVYKKGNLADWWTKDDADNSPNKPQFLLISMII